MDYVAFALAVILSHAMLRVALTQRSRQRKWITWFDLLLLGVLVIGGFYTKEAEHYAQSRVMDGVASFLPTYASEFELRGHNRLVMGPQWDEKLYRELIETEKRWLRLNRDIADIYTWRMDDQGVPYLLVDSETDYDGDGLYLDAREQRTPPGTRSDSPQPAMVAAFQGKATTIHSPYRDRWGSWVSAYQPLRSPEGRVEAVIGIDYSADKWQAYTARARGNAILKVLLAVLILIYSYTAVSLLQIDVRRRRQVEAELESRVTERTAEIHRLATAIDQAEVDVIITDADGTIQYVNPSFTRTTGYSVAEAVRSAPSILKSGAHSREFYANLWATILAGDSWRGRITNRTREGQLIEQEGTISPIQDGEHITGFVAIRRDITRQVKLEEELLQSRKMEAMGQLAGGVAHDFNNLLTAIIGHADLPMMNPALDPKTRQHLTQIRHVADQATALTRRLLAFCRKQVLQPRVISLNEVVEGMEPILRRLIGEHIELVTILSPKTDRVMADPNQMEQVVMNLALNARDAMPGGGRLIIETARVHFDSVAAGSHQNLPPGDYSMLAVSDTGTGMDRVTLQRLFEPFFTTKEAGRGTGLGLATVQGIIKQSGGAIFVYSELGLGSSFKTYLPASTAEAEPRELSRPTPPLRGDETVLLVEDELAVCALCEQVLQEYGYHPLVAHTPEEALAIGERLASPLHLLVTDIILPSRIRGWDLARRMLQQHPGIRVLLISGYTDGFLGCESLPLGGDFLQKPFTPEQFMQKIRQVLDTPSPPSAQSRGPREPGRESASDGREGGDERAQGVPPGGDGPGDEQ